MPPSGPPAVSPAPTLPFPARWSCYPLEAAAPWKALPWLLLCSPGPRKAGLGWSSLGEPLTLL